MYSSRIVFLLLLLLCAVFFKSCTATATQQQQEESSSSSCRSKDGGQQPPAHMSLDINGLSFNELNDKKYMRDTARNIIESIPELKGSILDLRIHKISNPYDEGISLVIILNDGTQFTIQTWPEHGKALINFTGRRIQINLQDVLLPIIIEQFDSDFYHVTYSIIPRAGWELDGNTNICETDNDDEEDNVDKDGEVDESGDNSEKLRQIHHMFEPVEIVSQHKYKYKVYEKQSPYQHIAIWDHQDSLDDSFRNDTYRSLFLDGVIQSCTEDEDQYHESLVHPAFIASSVEPKRVLIVGGGEGGTLRETLKWSSVQNVTKVDLDAGVIETSQKYLPRYSNCTRRTSTGDDIFYNCFDDERLDLYTEDFVAWFEREIGNDICEKADNEKKHQLYDIIIIDLLDTEDLPDEEWAHHLYSDLFFKRIACALSSEGVVVTNFGEAPPYEGEGGLAWTPTDFEIQKMYMKKMKQIQIMSTFFVDTRLYDTYMASFRAEWSFAIGIVPNVKNNPHGDDKETKKKKSRTIGRTNFEASPQKVDDKLQNGLIDKAYPLHFYSGVVQHVFQYPSSNWDSKLCNDNEIRRWCDINPKNLRNEEEIVKATNKTEQDLCLVFDTFMEEIISRHEQSRTCSFMFDGFDPILPIARKEEEETIS